MFMKVLLYNPEGILNYIPSRPLDSRKEGNFQPDFQQYR